METVQFIAILLFGVGYLYTQFKNGGNKASGEVLIAYKEKVVLQDEQINKLTKELGVLEGTVIEKDKRIDLLTSIVENRNPEVERILTENSMVLKRVAEVLELLQPLLVKLSK